MPQPAPVSRQVRLFRNNRNQAVRIPVEFELPGTEAVMSREGDRLIIEPARKMTVSALLDGWEPLDEAFPDIADPAPLAETIFLTMPYMLDTNIVIDLIRNPTGRAAQRARVAGDAICLSVIVAAELRYGCAKKASPQLLRRVEQFLSAIPVLPFDVPADSRSGDLRARLEAIGTPIGSNDLLVAAHAANLGATLVTANVGEFGRVQD